MLVSRSKRINPAQWDLLLLLCLVWLRNTSRTLKFKLHLGRYKKKKMKCQNCGFKNKTYEEKESDVRVATGMLVDVFTKRCDITIVVSADSDMIPSVEIIKNFAPDHPVHAFIPPNQKSFALISKCDSVGQILLQRISLFQS